MPQFRFEVSVSESWGRTNIESARCNSDSDDNTGTCMDARGMTDDDIMDGARRSSMDELAAATVAAHKVLVF